MKYNENFLIILLMNSTPSPESHLQTRIVASNFKGMKASNIKLKSNLEELNLNTEVYSDNSKLLGRSLTFEEQNFHNSKNIFQPKDQPTQPQASNDLCYKITQKYHTEKSFNVGSSINKFDIDTELSINAGASSLLNLQIQDLERRTKSNRISATSQRKINNFEDDTQDPKLSFSNNLAEKDIKRSLYLKEYAPSEKENKFDFNFTAGDFETDCNKLISKIGSRPNTEPQSQSNTINPQSDQENSKIINYNIVNFSPIITNNFNCDHDDSKNHLSNPNIILENYYYHLRQLQHYYSMYLTNISSMLIPEQIDPNSNSTTIETINHEVLSKSKQIDAKYSSSIDQSKNLNAEKMPEKQGWMCLSCSFFNFQSKEAIKTGLLKAKCSRCLKLQTKPILDPHETSNNDTELVSRKDQDILIGEYISSKNTSNFRPHEVKQAKHHERAGDWVCTICKNLNFSFRNKCNRCQASKEEVFDKENESAQNCIFRQSNIRPNNNKAQKAYFSKIPSSKNFNPSYQCPPLLSQNYQPQLKESGYYNKTKSIL